MAEAGDEVGSGAGGPAPVHGDVDFTAYVFPDTWRRRATGAMTAAVGVAGILGYALGRPRTDVVTTGLLVGGVVLVLVGGYFFAAGFRRRLDQGEALVVANREIGFPVGHASAVLGWRGPLARPTWRILLYSAEDPPRRRGLVELDAVTGDVLASYSEDNPEDWSDL